MEIEGDDYGNEVINRVRSGLPNRTTGSPALSKARALPWTRWGEPPQTRNRLVSKGEPLVGFGAEPQSTREPDHRQAVEQQRQQQQHR